ncbi:MAG: methionine--tRNA ligase subunit beta, partial [Eubacterium sp.]|nr:methionine--tRNA ligase subunit beta [Eubacterium sp.]
SDLANTLGNLVNRTVSMSNKYFGGIVENKNAAEPVDDDLKAVVTATAGKVEEKMKGLHVADSITEIFALFKRCNKYIDETMPWALAKDEAKRDRLATVLYNLVESITIGASLLEPYMPETTERILRQLNAQKRDYADTDKFGLYKSGTKVTEKPEILFARQDLKEVMEKVEEIRAKQKAASGESGTQASGEASSAKPAAADGSDVKKPEIHIEPKPEITYDDFAKMQFAVGEVLECKEVPKSKKLLVSQVKFGDQTRQIVSGIKKWYRPEDMVGRKVMCLINLKPAKLAGLESQGMILAAEDSEGNIALMSPEKDMPSGSGIF